MKTDTRSSLRGLTLQYLGMSLSFFSLIAVIRSFNLLLASPPAGSDNPGEVIWILKIIGHILVGAVLIGVFFELLLWSKTSLRTKLGIDR